MQRITSLAACRELGGLAACTPGLCAWRKGPTCSKEPAVYHRHWAGVCVRPARPFSGKQGEHCWRLCRRKFLFAGQRHRSLCSQSGAEGPRKSSDGQPDISVVGIPDPITWIRCRVIMYLINLYFELDINSVEFTSGVKQALVHISDLMSSGRYHRLVGVVSAETRDYVEAKCKELTVAERKTLAVAQDEIVFVLPEDVSVVFDQFGRKFCFVVMRFWFLSSHEGPEDPEGARIFKVDAAEDEVPQKKIATAVYEEQKAPWSLMTISLAAALSSATAPSHAAVSERADERSLRRLDGHDGLALAVESCEERSDSMMESGSVECGQKQHEAGAEQQQRAD